MVKQANVQVKMMSLDTQAICEATLNKVKTEKILMLGGATFVPILFFDGESS